MTNKNNHKHEKIESEILNNLNHALKNSVNDKLLRMACFTYVRLLDDYSKIIVSVDYYDNNKLDKVVEQLNVAKGLFRDQLAKNMNIRKVPELLFEKDMTIQNSLKIEKIITDIHNKK
ncbi:MAG: 30S ribosome-binding factor RbfA [Mycoplasmoidaceae bacterium]|nr:30S ribosome-binding factor RbfA [Mycoplasmoidaceae bacterium]